MKKDTNKTEKKPVPATETDKPYDPATMPILNDCPAYDQDIADTMPYAFVACTNAPNLIERLRYYLKNVPDAILSVQDIIKLSQIVHEQLAARQKLPIEKRCPFADMKEPKKDKNSFTLHCGSSPANYPD